MEFTKIISVTGLSGLYELVSAKKDGAIIKSLDDKTTKFVAQRIHNFSNLENIEVYTVRDNVNLTEVFFAMQASKEPLPSEKDAAAVKAYFQKVYPDMDFERVYASDMKKMVKWFDILKANNIEIKAPAVEPEEIETAEPVEAELVKEVVATKPKAAKAKAKTAENAADTEAAPKAKAAPKKKD